MSLLVFLSFCAVVIGAPAKIGVFEGVTVRVKDHNGTEVTVFIEFDDALGDYLTKPWHTITITKQYIPKLDTNSVANLPHVRNLTLSYDGIREIRRGTFKNLPSLQVLNLSHNVIEEVRNGVFNNLPITELCLDNNHVSKIAYKAFSNLHLMILLLNNNRISRWSRDWFIDTSVGVLNVASNLIAELPQNSFSSAVKSTNMSIIFTDNQLTNIGNDVFLGFNSYKDVFLDHNSIEYLSPGAFNGVKYIRTLNLNANRIRDVNSNVLNNTKIDVLMLEDNRLTCLSTEVFHMEELDIDGNPITCSCVKLWLEWSDRHSNPSIYHITNLEEDCI